MPRFTALVLIAIAMPSCAQNVAWVSMQENQERSFSVDVPKGWNVTSGIVHVPGLFEFRMWVDMKSPDGRTEIRLGDPNVSMSYSIPDSVSTYFRIPEGSRLQNHMLVMRYQPGQTLAEMYGRSRFEDSCSDLQTRETKVLPPIQKVSTNGFHSDAGQAIFQCHGKTGQDLGGYVFAETLYEPQLTPRQLMPMANWLVTGLGSFLAPREQGVEVFKIFYHVFSSFRINPQWWDKFVATFNAVARGNFQIGMGQIQASMQRFNEQSAASARQADDYSRAIMGQTAQRDANTGEVREVQQGPWSTYWSNAKGQVVSSAMAPGPGFTAMTPVK